MTRFYCFINGKIKKEPKKSCKQQILQPSANFTVRHAAEYY